MGFFDEDEEYQKGLREQKVKNAALLGRWVTVLFWLQIASVVAGVLADEVFDGVSVIQTIGTLATYGILIANSVILIKLKSVEDWFGKAGVCYLVSGFSGFVIALAILGGSTAVTSLLTIAMMIVELRGNYSECTGYQVVLQGVDDDLSGKWARQWKLEMICTVVVLVSAIMLVVSALFGSVVITIILGIVTLGTAIGALVLGIMRLVYLYQTAKCFREYRPGPVGVVVEDNDFDL